jgi:hypothetical protein
LCTEPTWELDALGELGAPGVDTGGADPFRTACWWADASLVWLTTNSMNDASTIRQVAIDAMRNRRAREATISLD